MSILIPILHIFMVDHFLVYFWVNIDVLVKPDQKLDKILNLLEPDDRCKNNDKDKDKASTAVKDDDNNIDVTDDANYYEEQINYLWNEDFFDILCLRFFVSRIYAYAEDFAEVYHENDVRIITYIS